jgi:hypothetical protein
LLVTFPAPIPTIVSVNALTGTKLAVTLIADATVRVQVLIPAQYAEIQPANADPADGTAVRVTTVPLSYFDEQVTPQSMPVGELVTVPLPVPAMATVTVYCGVGAAKVAVTLWLAFIVTLQAVVPVHAPLQLLNAYPEAALAARSTAVPEP